MGPGGVPGRLRGHGGDRTLPAAAGGTAVPAGRAQDTGVPRVAPRAGPERGWPCPLPPRAGCGREGFLSRGGLRPGFSSVRCQFPSGFLAGCPGAPGILRPGPWPPAMGNQRPLIAAPFPLLPSDTGECPCSGGLGDLPRAVSPPRPPPLQAHAGGTARM